MLEKSSPQSEESYKIANSTFYINDTHDGMHQITNNVSYAETPLPIAQAAGSPVPPPRQRHNPFNKPEATPHQRSHSTRSAPGERKMASKLCDALAIDRNLCSDNLFGVKNQVFLKFLDQYVFEKYVFKKFVRQIIRFSSRMSIFLLSSKRK